MKKLIYISAIFALILSSCNYLEVDPVGQVIPHKVSDYRALMTSAYQKAQLSKRMTALLSDEIDVLVPTSFGEPTSNTPYLPYFYNIVWQSNSIAAEFPYQQFYNCMFYTNDIIANVMNAQDDASEAKEQVKAEALSLRAYAMFDLLNLYSKPFNQATAATDKSAPLYTVIDINQKFIPTTVERIYKQIFEDLAAAEELMQIQKQTGLMKYRFSKDALTAFNARIRLYRAEWQESFDLARSLTASYPLVDINSSSVMPYISSSSETIMALEKPGIYDVYLSNKSLDRFVNGDMRADKYYRQALDPNFPPDWGMAYDQYISSKSDNGNLVSFRSSEIYLIAAEAAAHLSGKLDQAKSYLTELQNKRFNPTVAAEKAVAVAAMNQEQLLEEIAEERARELLLEGHRWFDLRRTTRPEIVKIIDKVRYTLAKDDTRYTLSFPRSAIDANPDLTK